MASHGFYVKNTPKISHCFYVEGGPDCRTFYVKWWSPLVSRSLPTPQRTPPSRPRLMTTSTPPPLRPTSLPATLVTHSSHEVHRTTPLTARATMCPPLLYPTTDNPQGIGAMATTHLHPHPVTHNL